MPKVKTAFSIDAANDNWLIQAHADNKSQFVDNLITKARTKNRNYYEELEELEKEQYKLNNYKEEIIKELERVLEEGNKQERTKAEEQLKKIREQEEQKKQRPFNIYIKLETQAYWQKFLDKYNSINKEDKKILDSLIYNLCIDFKKSYDSRIYSEDILQILQNLESLKIKSIEQKQKWGVKDD